LLAIDVTVVDANGNAVRDLKPEDFIVEVAGQRRKVVRSDFVDFTRRDTSSEVQAPRADVASNQTDARLPDPRLILLVVDDESFTIADGRRAFVKLADAMGHAFPGDMLAFAPLSGSSAGVEFTTDRQPVVRALRNLSGRRFYSGTRTDLGMAEALDIYRGNSFALERAVQRECPALAGYTTPATGSLGSSADPCLLAVKFDAMAIAADIHAQTQRTLRSVARQLEGLGRLPGVKYLVLVSQGVYLDDDVGVAGELARVAAAASVTLQVLYIDRQDPGDVNRARPTPQASRDALLAMAGLDIVAGAAGGNVERAITEPLAAFERISHQIATVYRLGVDTLPEDAVGGTKPIVVKTTRPGLTVHTHRQVVLPAPAAAASNARLQRALESPLLDRDITMRMSAYGYRSGEQGGNIIVSAEVEAPRDGLRVGYAVRDPAGRPVGAAEVAPGAITASEGGRALVVFRSTAPIGEYTVKVAAVDAEGRTGSVAQSVSLPRFDAQRFALGDLIVLPAGVDLAHARPAAHLPKGSAEASVYFELYSAGPTPAEKAVIVLEVISASGAPAGSTRTEISMTKAGRYSEAAGQARFSPAKLLPGPYLLRLSVEGSTVHGSRQFTVE
jgi:hypothetical protein